MGDIETVRLFVQEEGPRYLKLLERVKRACQDVEKGLDDDIMVRFYSRGIKQAKDDKHTGEAELKDTEKIFAACARPVTTASLRDISDIIGVTVVVQYPDQIDRVLDALVGKLGPDDIAPLGERRKMHGTYFATHQVFRSTNLEFNKLRCEVQCKTMLHDGWSTKMHDLTYKPQGSLDERMKQLIESISGTIEGLERQSMIVRDMITARQAIEQRPFQASLNALYLGLRSELQKDWAEGAEEPELKRIRDALDLHAEHLTSCSDNDASLREWKKAIEAAAENPALLRGAWILAVRLAGFRATPPFGRFLRDIVEQVIEVIGEWRERDSFTDRELAALPLGFYAIQDFTRALEYTDRILERAAEWNLSPFRELVLRLNKLTWLLERESLHPSKATKRKDLYESVRRNLDELAPQVALPDNQALSATLADAQGLFDIVFGTAKETVRQGIRVCSSALAEPADEPLEADVDAAYAEWRTQFGWRRYFDLAEEENSRAETSGPSGPP